MSDKIIETNQAAILGIIETPFTYSHEVYGERFYKIEVSVERTSGRIDCIPVIISERIVDVTSDCRLVPVKICGQIRSFKRYGVQKNKRELFLFARTIEFATGGTCQGENNVYLEGIVCKKPTYRETPNGRDIADMVIEVKRSYGKHDYIPCICWGRDAWFAERFVAGDYVRIEGRIQSRTYKKRISDETEEERIAYEVSVSRLAKVALGLCVHLCEVGEK